MRDRLRAHPWLTAAGVVVILGIVIGGGAYWLSVRRYEATDDAFIAARSFSVAPKAFLVMLATGAVLIATIQMLPQLLQAELNYTALLAGLALSPGGVITMMMMPVVGRLVSVVQPKYLLVFGACVVAGAMWYLTGLTGDITYGYAGLVARDPRCRPSLPVPAGDL